MTDTDKVTMGIEATKEMVEQLGKAFLELESHRDLSSQNKTEWEDIKQHFDNLGTSLEKKLTEVEEKEKSFAKKQSEAHNLITEREVAVAVNEQSSLNRLQELKDTAVSAIAEARKNCKVPTPVVTKGSKDNKVSTIVADDPSDNKSDDPSEVVAGEVRPLPRLKELCEQMDAKGLLKFLSDNRKNLATISQELSNALKSASEPARLVLDSLEGFFPPDPSNSQRGEAAIQLLRRTCLGVMESAAPLLGMAEPCDDHPLSSEIKQQAKAIADEWKAKLAGVNIAASNGYSLEAVAFLQLLATFSIADEFDEDELCKLVPVVSRRRQAPELCRSLGLTQKIPGLIETLVNSGRQIDAVHFAHAFQLTETFPPVPLLKEYLDRRKTTAEENTEDISTANGKKEDINRELGALKIVVKCIEEYKLQEQYPVEPLKKRIAQLEKEKQDKKRTGQATNSQAKKVRANVGYAAHRKPPVPVDDRQLRPPVYDERGFYPSAPAERYPERYNYAVAPTYDVAAYAAYSQQPTAQKSYHYPDERVAPPAPYSAPSNYGSYAGADERVAPPVPYGSSSSYGSYGGAGYHQSSDPNNYGNYMGASGHAAPSTYGGYTGPGVPPSHQSYM